MCVHVHVCKDGADGDLGRGGSISDECGLSFGSLDAFFLFLGFRRIQFWMDTQLDSSVYIPTQTHTLRLRTQVHSAQLYAFIRRGAKR